MLAIGESDRMTLLFRNQEQASCHPIMAARSNS